MPDRLAAVPLDPDDGKPLRYAVDGREWMLYGIGRDRRDDGGRHRRDDPETGSRRANGGFDVVYAITPAMRERTAE